MSCPINHVLMYIFIGFSMACSRSGDSEDALNVSDPMNEVILQCPVSGDSFNLKYSDFKGSLNVVQYPCGVLEEPFLSSGGQCFASCFNDVECKNLYDASAGYCSNGDCVECRQNSQCVNSVKPYCLSGQCVACTNDTQCKDPSSPNCFAGRCVECKTSQQCKDKLSSKPICSNGSCRTCNNSVECRANYPDTPICDKGSCRQAQNTNECSINFPGNDNYQNGKCVCESAAVSTNSRCKLIYETAEYDFGVASCIGENCVGPCGNILPHQKCCGNIIYQSSNSICCEDRLRGITTYPLKIYPNNLTCCAGSNVAYDSTIEVCGLVNNQPLVRRIPDSGFPVSYYRTGNFILQKCKSNIDCPLDLPVCSMSTHTCGKS
jgi:hypothetical protein